MPGAGVEGLEAEVVEDEEIGAAEGSDQARMAAVATSEREVGRDRDGVGSNWATAVAYI